MAGHQIWGADSIGDLTKVNSTIVELAASTITLGGLQYDTTALQCTTVSTGAGGAGQIGNGQAGATGVIIIEEYYN